MKAAIIGASGYVGAELTGLLEQHPNIELTHLLVSENSESCGMNFSELYPRWQGIVSHPLSSFSSDWLKKFGQEVDAYFLATPHEFSQNIAADILATDAWVFDLSGAFRLNDPDDYPKYYGFKHSSETLLASATYGLAEWNSHAIENANLIAVPGCYPTASLLSILPLTQNNLVNQQIPIVVNGISGVSGAGRKASMTTSFNEVSLTAYNVLKHRHQPEISQEANHQVIFNPHLAPYKRGLLATVTVQLSKGVTAANVEDAFKSAYKDKTLVRIAPGWPKIDQVANTPFADIYWQVDESLNTAVISCAIDNLLKGAASQAVQCLNIKMNLTNQCGLLGEVSSNG